ncbi:MAG: hypothetical protein KKA81_01005 [Bacteroidetes bacterium]|nr:hypothetical protein [Bacteroidota bacterium]
MNKIKPFVLAVIWIFLLAVPVLCAGEWVVEKRYSFRLNIPDNWSKTEYSEGKDYVFDFMSPDKKMAVQVRVSAIEKSISELGYLINPFEKALSHEGIQKLSMDECIHNGTTGKLGVYTTGFGEEGAGIATFYAVRNGFGYIVLFIIPNNLFDIRRDEMDQIMKSFEILSPEIPVAATATEPVVSEFEILEMVLEGEGNQRVGNTYIFPNETPRILAWLNYKNAPPKDPVIIRWASITKGKELNRTVIQTFPNSEGKTGSTLYRPNQGWLPGEYKVEILYRNEIIQTAVFEIEAPEVTEIAKENEQPSQEAHHDVVIERVEPHPTVGTEHYIRQIKLGPLESFDFHSGSVGVNTDEDLVLETSCNYKLPTVKGNWALTGKADFQAVTAPPQDGYVFERFPDRKAAVMPTKEVVVFKLEDGSFAKVMVIKHAFLEAVSEPRCRHYIEALVEYPVFY